MSKKRLLGVFAHPDDETFGPGSVLARYAHEGVDVMVVCTTRGEVGEIAPGSEATPETLGEVREGELRRAAGVLGVKEVISMGYRDSGMPGSGDNRHPQAFINARKRRWCRSWWRLCEGSGPRRC
jgi:LmbE family N-acetylglucosaminyl deacetylase